MDLTRRSSGRWQRVWRGRRQQDLALVHRQVNQPPYPRLLSREASLGQDDHVILAGVKQQKMLCFSPLEDRRPRVDPPRERLAKSDAQSVELVRVVALVRGPVERANDQGTVEKPPQRPRDEDGDGP